MIEIKITTEGLEKVRQALLSKADKIDEAVANAVLKGALDVETDAKKLCPVDTGRLWTSITHTKPELVGGHITAKVGSNVEYAPWVEFNLGSHHRRGPLKGKQTAFLYPALEKNFNAIDKNIRDAVKNITKGG